MGDINLYSKLMKMRVELQKEEIKKTGENKFSNFTYYELADFLPQCNRIAANNNTIFLYQLEKEQATLTLINCENTEEKIIFYLPLAELSIKGANGIQNIGGLATYTRRYLYLIAFEISESDEFDPNENNTPEHKSEINTPEHKNQDKSTPEQQKQIAEISKQKIAPVKVHIIQKELLRTGVPADAICGRYKVAELSDITEELFPRVMDALKRTPDLAKGDQ